MAIQSPVLAPGGQTLLNRRPRSPLGMIGAPAGTAPPGTPTAPAIAPPAPGGMTTPRPQIAPAMQGLPNPAQPNQQGFAQTSQFGPGQNLIGTQIAPGQTQPVAFGQDVTQARQTTGQLLGSLAKAPSRQQLAEQSFKALEAATLPQMQQQIRGVGQQAASLGRLGMGQTAADVGDVFRSREANLANIRAQLASQTAGETLQDQLNRLGASSGITGQFAGLDLARQGQQFGQESALRGELRGERGYQQGLQETATDRGIQQRLLEDQLLGSQFGRDQSTNQLLSGIGFQGVDPLQTYIAQQYGQQGQQSQQAVGDVLGSLGQQAGTANSPELEAYLRQQRARQIAGNPQVVGD